MHIGREGLSLDEIALVMPDHRLQRWDAAVMHIRAALGDVAQGRRLESMLQLDDVMHELAAADVFAREADVLKAIVGETPTGMADGAIGLLVEGHEAALSAVA